MKKIAAISAVFLTLTFSCAMRAQDTGQQNSNQPPEGRRGNYQQMRGTAGTITAINGDTLTVKLAMNDSTVTVKLNDKTEYRKDREPAKLSDLRVGDFVMIRGEHTSESEVTASAVMTGPPGGGRFAMRAGPGGEGMANGNMADLGKTFIVGEVKAIDGAKITVHRPDDQDQTIQADENTSFRKAGESITLPDIKAGDTIMGRGAVKDGVFVPATINVVDPQRMQMMRRRPAEPEKPQTQSQQPPR
ncbi:MAG TPA: DUF5666 domain-containing protein [Candidatus Binataceae bacterium]|nr:DUF5666 domain-containing protein [Candidatus Binataceae bacterium]